MVEFSSEWPRANLGDLTDVSYGLTVNKLRRMSSNRASYLTVANVKRGAIDLSRVKEIGVIEGDIDRYQLKKGDVLVVEGNGNPDLLGAASVWQDDTLPMLHQNHLIRVRCTSNRTFPSWLCLIINGDIGHSQILENAKTSSGLYTINSGVIRNLTIPLPPLPEQRKIAAILSSVDEAIEKTQAVIDQVQVVKKGLIQELLTKGLPGRHKSFKDTAVGRIPVSWAVVRVGEVMERVRRAVTVQPSERYREIGVRSHGRGVFHKEPVLGNELGDKSVFWVTPGTMVTSIVFAWERAVAEIRASEQGMIASHRFPMYLPNERLNVIFSTLYFQSPGGNQALIGISPGGAGRNKTMSQSDFLKLSMPLPPREEQDLIVSTYKAIVVREERNVAALDALKHVKSAISSLLLTGELRVRPDPEPTP